MGSSTTDKPCILYLDAVPEQRRDFKEIFATDFTVLVAASPEKAHDLLRRHDILAVVGDQPAGDSSILHFFAEIRASFQDVFRILLLDAAHVDQQTYLTAINQANVYHLFTRPFEPAEVRLVIHHGLDSLNQKRQLQAKIRHIEIEEASRLAEDANQHKSRFLADMSHEIRTPLNAIIGMAHLIAETSLSNKQLEYINKINQASRNMLDIINDILDLSKIEVGKLKLKEKEFTLEDILQNVTDIAVIKRLHPSVELIVSTGADVPATLIGDPLRLTQVLINLVTNAAKFTDMGEIIISTELLQKEEDHVDLRFSVMDTGIGMTAPQQAVIFEAFQQADNAPCHDYSGTGLGLTISRLLVGIMGGTLQVESRLGQGSTFSFELTLARPAADRGGSDHLPEDLRHMPVLVVDDHPTVRKIFRIHLQSLHLQVTLAASGHEALALIDQAEADNEPFQLIICDWQMPGLNGIECARRILAHTGLSRQPAIIMVTAYDSADIHRQAEELGLSGLLFKPVNKQRLVQTILTAFNKKRVAAPPKQVDASPAEELKKVIAGAEILIAEDNSINRQVTREILESWGVTATMAHNGHEVVELVKKGRFDLLLLDIQMPVMDGFEACRQVRQWEQHSPRRRLQGPLPIIAMTAYAMGGDREKCLATGMDDHLAKPLDPDNLFDILVTWLAKPAGKDKDATIPVRRRQSIPPDLPGIDQVSALRRLAGNKLLYRNLLIQFAGDYREILPLIEKYIDKYNWPEATKLVHTLKNVAGNIGALEVVQATTLLEKELRQKGPDTKAYFKILTEKLLPIQQSLAEAFHELSGQRRQQSIGAALADEQGRMKQLTMFINSAAPEAKPLFYILKPTLLSLATDETWQLQEFLEEDDFEQAGHAMQEILRITDQ